MIDLFIVSGVFTKRYGPLLFHYLLYTSIDYMQMEIFIFYVITKRLYLKIDRIDENSAAAIILTVSAAFQNLITAIKRTACRKKQMSREQPVKCHCRPLTYLIKYYEGVGII